MPQHAQLPYQPIAIGAPVALLRNACLHQRSKYAECRHCETNCPSGALSVQRGGMDLRQDCLGCGRCMAACPTGALRVQGFPPKLELDAARRDAVRVECWRAAERAEVRVPCLGGLSVSRLLAIRLAAGERPVELIDRGWCAQCPCGARSKEHPATKSLARARARLSDAGVPEALMPELKSMPAPLPAEAPQRTAGRRGFMARLSAPFRNQALSEPFVPAPAPDREQTLGALARLARRYGGEVSQKLFHRVEVNERCSGHGVCAAGCPTGALRLEQDEGRATLSHSSEPCIGCGHCERVCPEKGARLVFGEGRAGRRIVARFQSTECSVCGALIRRHGAGRGNVCERCEKSSAFAQSAFNQLYSSRAGGGSND